MADYPRVVSEVRTSDVLRRRLRKSGGRITAKRVLPHERSLLHSTIGPGPERWSSDRSRRFVDEGRAIRHG